MGESYRAYMYIYIYMLFLTLEMHFKVMKVIQYLHSWVRVITNGIKADP